MGLYNYCLSSYKVTGLVARLIKHEYFELSWRLICFVNSFHIIKLIFHFSLSRISVAFLKDPLQKKKYFDSHVNYFFPHFQPGRRPHKLREVLAAGQTGDGVYRLETGHVSVPQGGQGHSVPHDWTRL